jgi:hypothetical protein
VPIIWKDHIFLTAVDQGALVTIALRRTDGAVLWRRVAPTESIESVHAFNNPAAPTPTTDGERVYAYFGRVAERELPPEAGVHLRPEVPRDTPDNFMPLTEALRSADADKNGIMTKAEWEARASRGLSEIPSPLCYQGRVYFVKSPPRHPSSARRARHYAPCAPPAHSRTDGQPGGRPTAITFQEDRRVANTRRSHQPSSERAPWRDSQYPTCAARNRELAVNPRVA